MNGDATPLSVVLPVLNEQDNLEPLHARLVDALEPMAREYEVIYVDDGSTDGSWEALRKIAARDRRVRLVRLRRNFGQTAALAAGFAHSRYPIVVTLDADLQNDPDDIPRLVAKLGDSNDVVSGWRRHRKDPWLTRLLPSHIANFLIRKVIGVRLHDFGCTLKAYRREIMQDLNLYGELHRFLPVLATWVGGRVTEMEVTHHPRTRGTSKYGLLAYRVFVLRRLEATPLVFLMVIFFLTGVFSLFIGFLAEIVIRGFYDTQRKPIYHVRETVGVDRTD